MKIEAKLANRDLFTAITDDGDRDSILASLKSVRGRIPSFHLFQQDSRYLHGCVKVLQLLLDRNNQGTLRQKFRRIFNSIGRIPCEIDEDTIGFFPCPPGGWKVALCQLYLSTASLYHFAHLASTLGFRNKTIHHLRGHSSSNYATATGMDPPRLKLTTSDFGEYTVNRRCGRPFSKAYYNDRRYLLFPIIFEEYTVRPKINVTSMAIHRDICLASFGDVKELTLQLHVDRPHSDPPPQADETTDRLATRQASSEYSRDIDASGQSSIITENDCELAPGFESKALPMESFIDWGQWMRI
ncbi:hypothetical protein PISL3812_05510 [Talaromyces islandicus]|uniref:Uncharacterized protein n=1 Tax=Talaromyces islandicus TaxID=28573 RepID=A0A0U1M0G7_TALIS|nr:hypothetical protein PISL3812_05510 [Talaromyces islandicus]